MDIDRSARRYDVAVFVAPLARAALVFTCLLLGVTFGFFLLSARSDDSTALGADDPTNQDGEPLTAALVESGQPLTIQDPVEDAPNGEPVAVEADSPTSSEAENPTSTEAESSAAEPDLMSTEPASPSPTPTATRSEVPLVIYDTDMGPDTDDALALAMLHTYQNRGAIELAAVTLSRNSVPGASFIDVLNTFYGRGNIPIGTYLGNTVDSFDDRRLFVSLADSWPHDLDTGSIPEGYRIQRQVLERAIAENREVIIIQTGFSGNTAALTRSGPDDLSSSSGIELIRRSDALLSIMAGAFDRNIVEFNIKKDLSSARDLFNRWPTDMIVSPFELGYRITYPYESIRRDYGWVDRHPVREAYEFRDLDWHEDAPPFYNMRSWDLTSVMVAIEPDANYFPVSNSGTVYVDGSGRTTFQEGSGRHRILHRSHEYSQQQRDRIVNRMIELSSARR